jgi:hypothetical protein
MQLVAWVGVQVENKLVCAHVYSILHASHVFIFINSCISSNYISPRDTESVQYSNDLQ